MKLTQCDYGIKSHILFSHVIAGKEDNKCSVIFTKVFRRLLYKYALV